VTSALAAVLHVSNLAQSGAGETEHLKSNGSVIRRIEVEQVLETYAQHDCIWNQSFEWNAHRCGNALGS